MTKVKCHHRRVVVVYSPDEELHYVECRDGCWLTGPARSTDAEAIKAWNARLAMRKNLEVTE